MTAPTVTCISGSRLRYGLLEQKYGVQSAPRRRSGEILTPPPPLSQRMIGITGEQLRRIPEVVAVAGGVDKADAVGVVLRAGFVTTLITNASVAQQLLKQDPAAALTSQSSSASDR